MITRINNAYEAMEALSENHELLITGKRKPIIAKEASNTIGKMINLAKTQLVMQMWTGDKREIKWLKEGQKKLNASKNQ